MSYAEELRKSRDKAQVVFQEFALHTRLGKDGLFCFFEGKDNAYYVPRIKKFILNYHPIKCGGREKVLEAYKLITKHREYERYKKAFFIDRDFNAMLGQRNPPIFETPSYSIENLYTSVTVFKEILKNEFHFSAVTDLDYKVCVRLFIERQNEFHAAVTLFNAWYSCLIDIRNNEGTRTGVNLDDKLPKDFISVGLDQVIVNYDIEKIHHTFPNATVISSEMLEAKLRDFSKCEQGKVFRGKYEMQFLLKFIELIWQDASKDKKYLKEKLTFSFGPSLNNDQAISVFSSYAETPGSLDSYLRIVTS